MAINRKNRVLAALSASHLRAIGKVAAQWSSLELKILLIISDIVNLSLENTVILAGSQNATAWGECIKKITRESKEYQIQRPGKKNTKKVATKLDILFSEIQTLQTERNGIVHSYWFPVTGILAQLQAQTEKKAHGVGVPKRGLHPFKSIEKTPSEMLAIASRIEAAEKELFVWHLARQKRLQLAAALRAPSENPTQPTTQPQPNKPQQ